jgi:hypothetical protein
LEVAISLADGNRDWEGLARKLSRGLTLERAAELTGIPFEEACEFVEGKLEKVRLAELSLHLQSKRALNVAVKKLKAIAKDGPRYSEVEYNEQGKPAGSRTPQNTDLVAAQTLLKFALDTQKLVRQTPQKQRGSNQDGDDLFDRLASEDRGSWILQDVEEG